MQQNSDNKENVLDDITYLIGNAEIARAMASVPSREPFDGEIVEFLNEVSKMLMTMGEAKMYPDVVTLGFWIRKSSVLNLKKRFEKKDGNLRMGRGLVFHIAPSNVPVNYAYSLVTGLLTGNANIVRVPSKDFPQVRIINSAVNEALSKFDNIRAYICLIRYEKKRAINDILSSMADVRVIWGGDHTIAELRESPLAPRAGEVTFADRYSLAVVDSDIYLDIDNKKKVAENFYNDTYLTDQNACTSPRIVIWLGKHKEEAKEIFWQNLHEVVKEKYVFQPIMGSTTLSSSYLAAAIQSGIKIESHKDNYIIRVKIPNIMDNLMRWKDNSGYFFEYDCEDILELRALCDNAHCQTIGFIGERETLFPLLKSGIRGVDRIVPIGKTMDFDLIWDGYDLSERLTRSIEVNI